MSQNMEDLHAAYKLSRPLEEDLQPQKLDPFHHLDRVLKNIENNFTIQEILMEVCASKF